MELCHRWYRGQERALPPVVQLPGRGSSTSGTVARKGLFHRWYSRQTLKLPMSHCTPSLPRRIQAKSYPTSLTFILISSSHLRLGLANDPFPQVSQPKSCVDIYCAPYLLHVSPIVLITRIVMESTDHKAPRFLLSPVTSSLLNPIIFVSTSFGKFLRRTYCFSDRAS